VLVVVLAHAEIASLSGLTRSAFPRRTNRRVQPAAEVTIGRGLGIDRLVEVQVPADARRRQVDNLADRGFHLIFGHLLACFVQVDIDRQRLGNADGVGQLDRATISQAGGDNILGEVAGDIGSRTVDLCRVLAGECTATMRCRTAVGVDDDLAAGQAGVTIRAADDELAVGLMYQLQSAAIGSVPRASRI